MANLLLGLTEAISNVNNHIVSSGKAVAINDAFPKAKHHYLVLPKEIIPSIFHLRTDHLSLLEELYNLAIAAIKKNRKNYDAFNIGFHAEPSMHHLHLHVISKDFVSDCLKTKKHWNSFNTKLFINYDDLYKQIQNDGCIKRLPSEQIKQLTSMELLCNQCKFIAKNIPKLKEHLMEHYINKFD